MKLSFEQGSLLLTGNTSQESIPEQVTEGFVFDQRTKQWRAEARCYREVVLEAHQRKLPLEDCAKAYQMLGLGLPCDFKPRPHQSAALEGWNQKSCNGVVVLPTGAGKTILAMMTMVQVNRSTLIVVPTIDLMRQWQVVIKNLLGFDCGMLGGGQKEIKEITVATYDSARISIEHIGNRFGFLIFDEVHHLPAPFYLGIAMASIAPFRLGLSATLERADGGEQDIFRVVGPLAYEAQVTEMVSKVLAPYEVINLEIPMTDQERDKYDTERKIYVDFVRSQGIDFSKRDGWMDFIKRSSRSPQGKRAMRAYRTQKKLAQASEAKIEQIWDVLKSHVDERMIIFTDDNETAYGIGRRYVLPVLTHLTKAKERKEMLTAFRDGRIMVLVTSKVLNEGVDVPEASVGVVVSGSGAVREHVQRLGRILRHQPGKTATLYEMVSAGTSETHVNRRRKQHHAYQGSH